MENWPGPRDAARASERRAVEVADPDADGDVARVADRPVVVIRLRRSRLHRDRKWKLEAAAPAEDVFASLGIGEDVGNPEGGTRTDQHASFAARSAGEVRRRHPFSAPCERRVRGHELVQPHFRVAERHAQAVVGGIAIEGRKA